MTDKLPVGTNFCRCSACGEYFTSVLPFDMHRTGKADNRSCLNADQMVKKGMDRNRKGYWVSQRRETNEIHPDC